MHSLLLKVNNLPWLVKILIIYIFLNALLWGGQELYWHNDTQEIKNTESALISEKANIEKLKRRIDTQSSNIDTKRASLERLKSNDEIEAYNSGVDSYNNLLNEYESSVDTYNSKITKYNSNVDRVNELIKQSGNRWYIFPLPIPSRSAKPKL